MYTNSNIVFMYTNSNIVFIYTNSNIVYMYTNSNIVFIYTNRSIKSSWCFMNDKLHNEGNISIIKQMGINQIISIK